jgi:4-amino-4-deoxy-L-arabinose transferase-like glycosyltransferase
MSPKTERNQYILMAVFLCFWFILNLLQAYFTELAHDEAYYWMYSRLPAWGYFDHPPMVAMLIRAGYSLIHNELGVRILFCLLGTFTLLLTYKISNGSPWLFMLITSAIVLVHTHVAGFLAIPDVPLVFFTALFFFLYRRYLEKDTVWLATCLAISIAGMFYSKYHGLLVVIFVFLSNLSLVKRKSAWMIVGMVTLAMVPHLLWQFRHGFPTLQYHLVSRSDGFVPGNIWNYLYSQVLVAGPLIAPLMLYFSLSYKPAGLFDRSLKFTLVGFLVFFFLSSFRDHIEAHWTAAAFVPMIVMAHTAISRNKKAAKWLTALAIPSLLLILLLRTMVAFDRIPGPLKRLENITVGSNGQLGSKKQPGVKRWLL